LAVAQEPEVQILDALTMEVAEDPAVAQTGTAQLVEHQLNLHKLVGLLTETLAETTPVAEVEQVVLEIRGLLPPKEQKEKVAPVSP
jgi:hypothetical protein